MEKNVRNKSKKIRKTEDENGIYFKVCKQEITKIFNKQMKQTTKNKKTKQAIKIEGIIKIK